MDGSDRHIDSDLSEDDLRGEQDELEAVPARVVRGARARLDGTAAGPGRVAGQGRLTHADVVAAGRAAFCWRTVSEELVELLGPDGVARVP